MIVYQQVGDIEIRYTDKSRFNKHAILGCMVKHIPPEHRRAKTRPPRKFNDTPIPAGAFKWHAFTLVLAVSIAAMGSAGARLYSLFEVTPELWWAGAAVAGGLSVLLGAVKMRRLRRVTR